MKNPPLTVTEMDATHSCIPEKLTKYYPASRMPGWGHPEAQPLPKAVQEPPLPLPALALCSPVSLETSIYNEGYKHTLIRHLLKQTFQAICHLRNVLTSGIENDLGWKGIWMQPSMGSELQWGRTEGKVIPGQVITSAREWRILSMNPNLAACSPAGKKA